MPQWPYTAPRDPEAIDILSQAYFDGDHEIRHMLRVLFNSDFFKEAQYARVKCPAELVAGTMRLSGSVTRPEMAFFHVRSGRLHGADAAQPAFGRGLA